MVSTCRSTEVRRRKLRSYANFGLVCIDEVGCPSSDNRAADLLFEVINRRCERRSVIVTTNRVPKEWTDLFPNAPCIFTLVDRLTHQADVAALEGKNYRLRESELEAEARRKRK